MQHYLGNSLVKLSKQENKQTKLNLNLIVLIVANKKTNELDKQIHGHTVRKTDCGTLHWTNDLFLFLTNTLQGEKGKGGEPKDLKRLKRCVNFKICPQIL